MRPVGAKASDLIFYNNSKARGLTAYSVKNTETRPRAAIDYLYRRDPSNFTLNGRYRIKTEDGKYRQADMRSLKLLNDIEFADAVNNQKLNPQTAKGRKALQKLYGENLEEKDPNWIKYHDDLIKRKIEKRK